MNNIVLKLATRLIAVGAILCYFSSCQFSPKTKNDNNVKFDSIKIEKAITCWVTRRILIVI